MNILLQFTVPARKFHRYPECTLQLFSEDPMLFAWVDSQVYLCVQQHPKYEQAIRLVHPPLFYNFYLLLTPTNKNQTELVLEIQTALSRYKFIIRHLFLWTFFLIAADDITSQNIDPSFWIIL